MAATESMQEQHSLIQSIASKLHHVSRQFPAINNVVGAVQKRKARDQLMIAAAISFSGFLTMRYLFF